MTQSPRRGMSPLCPVCVFAGCGRVLPGERGDGSGNVQQHSKMSNFVQKCPGGFRIVGELRTRGGSVKMARNKNEDGEC